MTTDKHASRAREMIEAFKLLSGNTVDNLALYIAEALRAVEKETLVTVAACLKSDTFDTHTSSNSITIEPERKPEVVLECKPIGEWDGIEYIKGKFQGLLHRDVMVDALYRIEFYRLAEPDVEAGESGGVG